MSGASTSNAVQQRSDALDRVSDGVVALDHNLRYTYVNARATELLNTEAESLLGENIWDVFPTTEGSRAQDAIEQALETGQMTAFERYNQELNKWWEVRVHPDTTGITLFFSDITEQKERLYELERTDTLFQNAQDGLFVIDVEDKGERFRVSRVNPAYETLSGAPASELQGKTIREITDETDSDAIREKYRECVDGRTSLEYEEYLSSFQSGSWWETRLEPVIVNDEVTQIVGSTRNITDRKERERRLQKFEQIVQNTGHAVFFTDVDGEIEYVNPAFERLTGYTAADALGETPHLLSSGEHDDRFFDELWQTVLDGNVWSGEIVNERKNGTRFVANHTIAPVIDDLGNVTQFVAIYDDITDQKERERELRQKTRALDSAPIGITIADPSQEDNPLTYVNERFTEATGYDEDESVGRNCRFLQGDGTDPEQVAKLRTAIDQVKSTETTLRNYRKDGTEFWNQLSITPVRDEDGALESFVGFQKDITERQNNKKKIQTHLVQAQKVGNVGSWFLDIDTNDLEWSDESYRIFGLEPGTPMTYDRFLEMVHPDDRDGVDEAWKKALESGGYDTEHRIMVDGETRWVQETAEIEFGCDGTPERGIGVVRDITEQVQQTREIRTQKQRYESLFNNVSGAIVVTDPDGHITTCNPGFTDLFGYDIDEIEGNHLSTIVANGDDVERLLKRADVPEEPQLIHYLKKPGQVFTGESRGTPLRTHDDQLRGHVIHIVDVSEAEANREQLQVLSRVLRHNVKNDMSVIQAHAELIKTNGPPAVLSDAEKIFEKSQKFVEMAENQHRITELLTDNSETVDLDLVRTTRQVISDVEAQYPDATVATDLATECPVRAMQQITGAIRELIENAIIHSDQEHPSVDIHLQCTGTVTELTIRDDGPGIPEQEWNVLTAQGEISALSHGTGLGLWFVNQVVRSSNGKVSFDTNDSGGTTVVVRLPMD